MAKMLVGDFVYPEGTQSWDDYVKNNPGGNQAQGGGLDKLFMIGILVVIFAIFY